MTRILTVVMVCGLWPTAAAAQVADQAMAELLSEVRALRQETEMLRARLDWAESTTRRASVSGPGPVVAGSGPSGSMPISMAESGFVLHSTQPSRNVLAGVFGVAQHRGMVDGGPQALEGYVYTHPPAGESIRLAMSLIGNGEHAGAGTVVEMRSPGGIVRGPGSVQSWFMHRPVVEVQGGQIDTIVGFNPVFPRTGVSRVLGVWIDDARAEHWLAGRTRVDTLTFANQWQLRGEGDAVVLVRPDGSTAQVFR